MNKNLRPFQPGQSGNISGRSKTEAEIAALARSHAPECVALLMEIARGKKQAGAARVMAMQELLNRGFGRASAKVVIDTDLASMSNPALKASLRELILEAAADANAIDSEAEPEA